MNACIAPMQVYLHAHGEQLTCWSMDDMYFSTTTLSCWMLLTKMLQFSYVSGKHGNHALVRQFSKPMGTWRHADMGQAPVAP